MDGDAPTSIYLGCDASTQSLSALVIDATGCHRRVLLERTIVYDEALPHYGTRHGMLPRDEPLADVVTADVGKGPDYMMGLMAANGLALTRIRVVSGAAQQRALTLTTVGHCP